MLVQRRIRESLSRDRSGPSGAHLCCAVLTALAGRLLPPGWAPVRRTFESYDARHILVNTHQEIVLLPFAERRSVTRCIAHHSADTRAFSSATRSAVDVNAATLDQSQRPRSSIPVTAFDARKSVTEPPVRSIRSSADEGTQLNTCSSSPSDIDLQIALEQLLRRALRLVAPPLRRAHSCVTSRAQPRCA